MAKKTPDQWFDTVKQWKDELEGLRKIMLDSGMEETIKWGMPCYTVNGNNVVGLGSFKNHYGIWFFQGVFLEDKHGLLKNAQEGKTKAMRQMRMDSEHRPDETLIAAYISEAIENAQEGKFVKPERKTVPMPSILSSALKEEKTLDSAFRALSPGKQKEFKAYIDEAKMERTKLNRLEKIKPMILRGEGLNDRYK